jgi:transcriptional regulator with XRE-family HTH domain
MPRQSAWWRCLVVLAELAGDVEQKHIARRLGVSKSAVTGWKSGTEPSPDAVRAAAKAYRDYVKEPDELLIELLQIAYVPDHGNGEPKKRTAPKRRT